TTRALADEFGAAAVNFDGLDGLRDGGFEGRAAGAGHSRGELLLENSYLVTLALNSPVTVEHTQPYCFRQLNSRRAGPSAREPNWSGNITVFSTRRRPLRRASSSNSEVSRSTRKSSPH